MLKDHKASVPSPGGRIMFGAERTSGGENCVIHKMCSNKRRSLPGGSRPSRRYHTDCETEKE